MECSLFVPIIRQILFYEDLAMLSADSDIGGLLIVYTTFNRILRLEMFNFYKHVCMTFSDCLEENKTVSYLCDSKLITCV